MKDEHICPPWIGRLLASPVRKLVDNPRRILGPYVQEGMQVADIGCGMGFFTLPLARMVGPQGRVTAVDVQEPMVKGTLRRVRRAGLADRVEVRLCAGSELGLADRAGSFDAVFAIAVVHEVPDAAAFMRQVHDALKPGGVILLVEPAGHVTSQAFERTLGQAREAGLTVGDGRKARRYHFAELIK